LGLRAITPHVAAGRYIRTLVVNRRRWFLKLDAAAPTDTGESSDFQTVLCPNFVADFTQVATIIAKPELGAFRDEFRESAGVNVEDSSQAARSVTSAEFVGADGKPVMCDIDFRQLGITGWKMSLLSKRL